MFSFAAFHIILEASKINQNLIIFSECKVWESPLPLWIQFYLHGTRDLMLQRPLDLCLRLRPRLNGTSLKKGVSSRSLLKIWRRPVLLVLSKLGRVLSFCCCCQVFSFCSLPWLGRMMFLGSWPFLYIPPVAVVYFIYLFIYLFPLLLLFLFWGIVA